jgi:membrane protease subunit HflC
MQKKISMLLSSILVVIILLISSAYVVKQTQYAIIFQFGEAVGVVEKPGLKFKIPFIQSVQYFDNRLLNVNVEDKELTAADGKRLIVNAFARFKIIDPVLFVTTVVNYEGSNIRINKIMESSMRKVIGRVALSALLSTERSNIMTEIHSLVNQETKAFGISIVDVRILRADLPKENSEAIYQRMQTEREREAKKIRAEGQEEAARIISDADKQSKILLAEAYMQSEILKGEGDKVAAKIYNEAFSKDQEFYKFYRNLLAYKNTLNKGDTNFVLSPDSDFFKLLKLNK